VQASIERLLGRISARTGSLDLIERTGLDVVPASLGGAPGAGDGVGHPGAMDIARALRESVLGEIGTVADLAAGTTSAQVLRLLGLDRNR
jgi:hypothetical protein